MDRHCLLCAVHVRVNRLSFQVMMYHYDKSRNSDFCREAPASSTDGLFTAAIYIKRNFDILLNDNTFRQVKLSYHLIDVGAATSQICKMYSIQSIARLYFNHTAKILEVLKQKSIRQSKGRENSLYLTESCIP